MKKKPGNEPRSLMESDGAAGWDMEDEVGYYLRIAQEAAVKSLQRSAVEFRPGRLAMLNVIARNPGLSQTDLSAHSRRDKSTITPAMVQLTKLGLIERRRVDQRTYGLYLTETGEELRRRLSQSAHEHDLAITEIIGAANKKTLIDLLTRLTKALEAV